MARRGTRVEGMREAVRLLEDLAPRAANNVVRNAVTDVTREVRDDIRGNAKRQFRKGFGTLFKGIVAKRRRGRRGEAHASVMITAGTQAKHDAFYWRFLEYGTSKFSARPFVRPAIDEAEQKAVKTIPSAIKNRVLKALEKMR